MLRGCLLVIVVLAGAYFAEAHFLAPLQLRFAEVLAPLLALGVTLSVSGLYGLPRSLRGWKKEIADIGSWEDGQVVQVIGRIKAAGKPLKAPVSGRDALIYEYNATAENYKRSGNDRPPDHKLHGMDACDCEIVTENGSVRVTGFTPLHGYEFSKFGGDAYLPAAAKFILGRKWTRTPDVSWEMIANPALLVGNKTGEWEGDVATEMAEDRLLKGLPKDREAAERQLLDRLRGGNWIFEEKILPPFTYVKLRGRYRTATNAIDINFSLKDALSSIEPAQQGDQPKTEKARAILNWLVITAVTMGLHYAVYHEGGRIYKDFIQWLRVEGS